LCYAQYKKKYQLTANKNFTIEDSDFIICHSPFNKLVQKSIGRFMYNDFLADTTNPKYAIALPFKDLPRQSTYQHKDVTSVFAILTSEAYKIKVLPTTLLPVELGNMYCASLYGGLMSLIDSKRDDLIGKRIILFSYGSGACSSLFSLKVVKSVAHIATIADVGARLYQRSFIHPEEFTKMLLQNEKRYTGHGYTPVQSLDTIFPGSFYLEKIDENYRRTYKRSATLRRAKL